MISNRKSRRIGRPPGSKNKPKTLPVDRRAAARQRDVMSRYSREVSNLVAEIGPYPKVVNPKRKKRCGRSLGHFLAEYFPHTTGLSPFGPDQLRMIARIEYAVRMGGLFLNLMFRGGAKSTISENAVLWAVLYGHRKFVPLFSSEAGLAASSIASLKRELADNDLLMADFPEVCHAVRALEGKVQRCRSQTFDGKLTHIEWTADTVALPNIPGSAAAGSVITALGITAAARGMRHKMPDGIQQRPDFIIVDDPQTPESAASDLQCHKRLEVLRKDILKLGGHGRRTAVVINATVMRKGDMVDQLADRRKFPVWQSERVAMVKSWCTGKDPFTGLPAHETMWLGEYKRLRETYDPEDPEAQKRAFAAATAYYKANLAVMDEGMQVSWEHCYDKDNEISAIQHAYNLYIDDGPDVFASECQNDPLDPVAENSAQVLTAEQIAGKLSNLARGVLPLQATRLLAYVDVMKPVLVWGVMATDEGFGGGFVDYGAWPEQPRAFWGLSDVRPRSSIQGATGAPGLEAQIYAALETFIGNLRARRWQREDGTMLEIERIGIDANWGDSRDVIYQFCRESPHKALLMPCHGRYVGPETAQFADWPKRDGERAGLNWRVRAGSATRYCIYDTNFWKSFLFQRLATAKGGRGCVSLFGSDPEPHEMFAAHLLAENGYEMQARGRKRIVWKHENPSKENHFLDVATGCCVMASVQGTNVMERKGPAVAAAKQVTYAEASRTRTVWGRRPPGR